MSKRAVWIRGMDAACLAVRSDVRGPFISFLALSNEGRRSAHWPAPARSEGQLS